MQLTLAARVRRLEDAVPGLKEKLSPNLDLQLEYGSFTRSGGHNVLGRVETLESVIEVLLTIQVSRGFAATREKASSRALLRLTCCLDQVFACGGFVRG